MARTFIHHARLSVLPLHSRRLILRSQTRFQQAFSVLWYQIARFATHTTCHPRGVICLRPPFTQWSVDLEERGTKSLLLSCTLLCAAMQTYMRRRTPRGQFTRRSSQFLCCQRFTHFQQTTNDTDRRTTCSRLLDWSKSCPSAQRRNIQAVSTLFYRLCSRRLPNTPRRAS